MNLKRLPALLFAAILSLTAVGAYAQTVYISEKISSKEDADFFICGTHNDSTFLIREMARDEYILEVFGDKMQKLDGRSFKLPGADPLILKTARRDDGFSFLFISYNKSNTMIGVARYKWSLNLDTLVMLDTLPSREKLRSRNFILSEDDRKVYLWYDMAMYTGSESCYDLRTGKKLWARNRTYETEELNPDYQKTLLSNSGEIYTIYNYRNRFNRKKINEFTVVHFDGYNENTFALPFGSAYWSDIDFLFDNLNQRITAAGLYSSSRTFSSNGTCFITMPATGIGAPIVRFQPFTPSFYTKLTGKNTRKTKIKISNTIIMDMVLRRDGGVILAAEEYRKFVRRSPMNPGGIRYGIDDMDVSYYYDDIILFSFDPKGETHWETMLRKRQVSSNDNGIYSSALVVKTRNNIRFLYNDDIKAGASIYEYVVNSKGDADRNVITAPDLENKVLSAIAYGEQVNATTVILPSLRRSEFKLVKIVW